jgi:hypothetical protein
MLRAKLDLHLLIKTMQKTSAEMGIVNKSKIEMH